MTKPDAEIEGVEAIIASHTKLESLPDGHYQCHRCRRYFVSKDNISVQSACYDGSLPQVTWQAKGESVKRYTMTHEDGFSGMDERLNGNWVKASDYEALLAQNAALKDEVEVMKRTYTPRRQITLCGSTKFKKAWMEWNARLTLEGCVVYSVAMWSHGIRIEPMDEQKELLDVVHKAKIDASDEIFVLDVGGYIGSSIRSEIDHAIKTGKAVRYLSQEYPDWTDDDCEFAQDYNATISSLQSSLSAAQRERGELQAEIDSQKEKNSAIQYEWGKDCNEKTQILFERFELQEKVVKLESTLKLFTDNLSIQSIDASKWESRKCATLGTAFRDIYRDGILFAEQVGAKIADAFIQDPLGTNGTPAQLVAYSVLFQYLPVMRRYIIDSAEVVDFISAATLADREKELAKFVFDELTSEHGQSGWCAVVNVYSLPVMDRFRERGFIEVHPNYPDKKFFRWTASTKGQND